MMIEYTEGSIEIFRCAHYDMVMFFFALLKKDPKKSSPGVLFLFYESKIFINQSKSLRWEISRIPTLKFSI